MLLKVLFRLKTKKMLSNRVGNLCDFRSELPRFIFIGLCTTTIHYFVLRVLYSVYLLNLSIATSIAFIFAVTFSYIANYSFTFRSQTKHSKSIPKFLTTTLAGFILHLIVLNFLTHRQAINLEIAFISTTMLVMLSNFLMNKFWVFSLKEED